MSTYNLLSRIQTKRARIGVIGLGYVGLPLAILFAKKGFPVIGFVRDKKKKVIITRGDYLQELGIQKDLKIVLSKNMLRISLFISDTLTQCDVIIVCVPTPIDHNKKPDLTAISDVAERIKSINLKGKLIVNESTVAPGTTHQVFGRFKGNYFLVCSPERVDPGNGVKTVDHIPKVVGGMDAESTELAKALYQSVLTEPVVPVSSLETAEMAKMLENTYRAVNIALVNEFAKLADQLHIDMLEVIAAAKTKWSFQAHYPSIGVGGHCIPVDPYYLLKRAAEKNLRMPVIKNSLRQNESMPEYVLEKLLKIYKKSMRVVVYGLSYKKNVKDIRESPIFIFCDYLKHHHVDFCVFDPFFSQKEIIAFGFTPSQKAPADLFVVGTDHDQLKSDYKKFITNTTIVLDGRNYFTKKVGACVFGVGRQLV